MKNNGTNKKRSIVKLSVSLGVFLVLAILLIVGVNSDLKGGDFVILEVDRYADAAFYTVGNTEYTGDSITAIDLDWDSGSVQIIPYEGSTVKLEETGATNEKTAMRTRVVNGKLIVQFRCSGALFFETRPRKTLTVYVPQILLTQIKNIKAETASATTSLKGLSLSMLDIDTASGHIVVDNVSADKVEIDTASGDVVLSGSFGGVEIDAASADVSLYGSVAAFGAELSSGDIYIEGVAEKIAVDTSSGDITVMATAAPSLVEIETASGDVAMYLPADVSFEAYHDGASGDMRITSAGQTETIKGKTYYGSGTVRARYVFDTSSGDVDIYVK